MTDSTEQQESTGSTARIEALGDHLAQIHGWLRGEMADVRSELEEFIAGDGDAPRADRTPPTLGLELQKNCLAFCANVHAHHSTEDASLFPALAADHPELAPTLEHIQDQHKIIAQIIHDLEALLADAAVADPVRLRLELNRLSSELDAHLTYEESELVDILNALPADRVDEMIATAQRGH